MTGTLTDKVAVISGGSRGIGKACAHKLAQEGCDVLLASRSTENLQAATQTITADTGRRVAVWRFCTNCRAE